ncbi:MULTISPECIES: helix-turn-helix transcriptional regulator [unclassified Pseudomonas]|jgi:DNA-binding CsgD family transcriptional regulator/PAS domain-containing protein|uniref:helix-turn-helix transcriptional regulator n=1 Tax=unclassified Pseudomonas TaxID=196821 RepID=UPI000DA9F2FA|nr:MULTISPECIES: helix-turn-helix transcriptional regulator [unclassified Pseudomonas]MDW3711684.1 helix-turn-helix transcriptional regulator [Pseudomonas sp. 2023EL-01195]PZE11128.1 helix-turn-helix transcriptional regulator [Pseudomonas sp. 57B-090624]
MHDLEQHHEWAGMSTREFSELLSLTYRGPLEPTPWASLLEALRLRFDAAYLTLVLRNPAHQRPGLIVNASIHGPHLPGEPSYSEHYYSICPFLDWPTHRVASADEVLGSQAWKAHAFYRNYLRPLDLRYVLVANMRTAAGMHCALFACRNHAARDFDTAERALVALLLPHLRQAVDLHSRVDQLDSERLLYAATIDRLLVGTAILDEAGKVMRSNQAAQRLFAARDGIECRQGKLHAFAGQDNRNLQRAILAVLQYHQHGKYDCVEVLPLVRPTGEVPLNVLLRPIALNYEGRGSEQRPALVVFIRDPSDSPQASRRLLRSLFQLTRTETEVAMLMMDGLTLDESAERLGVSRNTVRAHLRGVFAKTGATRQAQLVKTLLNSLASMA